MASNENKFSLLASLTSLPEGEVTTTEKHEDDDGDALPSLAVESTRVSSESELFQSSVDTASKLDSSTLLASSGLLQQSGGGLFDAIDEEERAAQEAEERRRLEEEEKIRIQEELRKEKEAADAAREQLKKEELEKKRAEEAALEARRIQEEQQQYQQQQMQNQNASYMHGSVMSSMQDLNLHDDPHQSHMNSQNGLGNSNYPHMQQNGQSNNLHPSAQNGQPNIQYSNVLNSSTMNRYENQSYSNVNPTHSQMSMASNMQQSQSQYSNVQNGNMQYSNLHQQSMTQNPPMPAQVQRQTTQEAVSGYGGASYVYSTTGNVQQVVSSQNQNGMVSSPPQTLPQMPPPSPLDASQMSSYAQRSQMRQNNMQHGAFNQNMAMNGQSFVGGGMNMGMNGAGSNVQPYIPKYNPANFRPEFGPITVTDPILVQKPGLLAPPPHWTYAVVVRDMKKIDGQNQFAAVVSNVRRRFRHFVALEERLRAECPGAILPPRPNKHHTRAIDEASTTQSAQFALQRAKELESYLNALRLHPVVGNSQNLKMFLTLADNLGMAWPEVSSSFFTRLTEAGANTAVKVAEGTTAVIGELNNENQIMAGEDNSELLALASSEGLRISSVLQSVPKIENAIALMAEQSQRLNNNGMEMQKLVNTVLVHEKEFSAPFEALASGLLRSGRRTNRLAVELGAAAQAFTLQHKLCRYERLAFSDRRSALIRRRDARKEADKKAQKLVMNQYSLQSAGNFGKLDGYGRDATMSDEVAVGAVRDAEEVAHVLQCEVARMTQLRRRDWAMSLKVMAANMREAHAERAAIWQSCKNSLNVTAVNNDHWNNGNEIVQGNNMDASHSQQVDWNTGSQSQAYGNVSTHEQTLDNN